MNLYSRFRKAVQYSCEELEKITGYTRQGFHLAFKRISQGERPPRRFIVCANAAINQKMKEEMERHSSKMTELQNLQDELEMVEI